MATNITELKLIDDGKKMLIAEKNGDLTIMNLETMEMSRSHRNVANSKELYSIALI